MHRYRMSPFVAFVASNPTSLLYLVIVILSFATKYTLGLHLIEICNTIWPISSTAFPASRRQPPDTTIEGSASPQTISPPPSTGTPPLPLIPPSEVEVQGANLSDSILGCQIRSWILGLDSFLDLSYEESSEDSGLGVSIASQEFMLSGDEEMVNTAKFTNPSAPGIGPCLEHSVFSEGSALFPRNQPTPLLSSESSFQLIVPGTPETDHDEDEEYVTLRVMASQRGSTRKRSAELRGDPIMDLIDRLARLNLEPNHRESEQLVRHDLAAMVTPKLVKCCGLASSTPMPDSWEDHEFRYGCLSFPRFIRPMDEDSFFRSTRLAVDNLTYPRPGHYLFPNQSTHHQSLSYAFKAFGSATELCFRSRIHGGVIIYESAFGVVDFRSEEEAHDAFLALQGRRIQGEKAHWRLEFLDPEDLTFGDRLPAIISDPPLELIRQLDAVTLESEQVDDALLPLPPSVRVTPARAFGTLLRKKRRQAERLELYRRNW